MQSKKTILRRGFADMSKHSLEVHDLVYRRGERAILRGINLNLGNGIFGLLGSNGAGKTTLLRLVATILAPSKGAITFDGVDAFREKGTYRKSLGYLPQSFGLYPGMSIHEQLSYFAAMKGMSNTKREVDRLLPIVGFTKEDMRCPSQSLSGGMKQRLGIAIALIGSPALVILDEPTAGLDPVGRTRLRFLLESIAQDAVVIISTHITQDVELCCSEMSILIGGTLKYMGSPHEVSESARGHVWQIDISRNDLERLKQLRRVVSVSNLSEDMAKVRFTGNPIGKGEAPVSPTLEDAYVYQATQCYVNDAL